MLRIDKLEVIGFKSFRDRTEVHLTGGITAVVGPNGCGKSNIGDAIHWVLGEQSARTLRGEKMEDVIFAGSEARKPMGMAEVTLRLKRAATAGVEGETIELSRRLYRSGESEYVIDGRRCRLKDVQEILQQERVGARTYAVIEQGKVEALLTARPKDRRLLIEEAAGIIGYKQKKRLAEMKLEATEANLFRVSDIVNEVNRQIGSLKRQAARARRYRRLQDEIRSLQRLLFVHEARRLDDRLAEVRGRMASASDREAADAAEVARLESAVEVARERLAGIEGEIAARREELHRIDLEIDRESHRRNAALARATELVGESEKLEVEMAALQERERGLAAEAEGWRRQSAEVSEALEAAAGSRCRLEATHAARAASAAGVQDKVEACRKEAMLARDRLVEARNERRRLEEEQRRCAGLLAKISSDLEEARRDLKEREDLLDLSRRRRAEAEAALLSLSGELQRQERSREGASSVAGDASEAWEEARRNRAAVAERLRTLSDAATRFGGRNEAVGYILTRASDEGIRTRGVVADYLRAGLDVERAAEGYLSDLLPTVLVEENEDVVRGIEALRREGAGRCVFLPERNGHSSPGPGSWGRAPAKSQGGSAAGAESSGQAHASRFERLPEELGKEPGVLGTLAEKIKAVAPYNGLITERFPDAVLVEDLAGALELHHRYPAHNFVTRDGDVVYASGLVAGGRSTQGGEGLLAQTRAIESARQAAEEALGRAEAAEAWQVAARAALTEAEQAAADLLERKTEAEKTLLALRLGEQRAGEDLERSRRTVELLEQERDQAGTERESLQGRFSGIERLTEGLEIEVQACEARLQSAEAEGRFLGETLLASGEELGKLRSEEAALSERREGIEREIARLEQAVQEVQQRRRQALAALDSARCRKVEQESEAAEASARLGELHGGRGATSERLASGEAATGELREEISRTELDARAGRERLDGARAERQQAEVESARLASDRGHLEERCRQELSRSVEEAQSEAGAAPAELDATASEAQIQELRRKIDSIGPVNMMALEQFVELEERFKFLTAQRQDLVSSIESLRETIRKINRSSRERFLEAFDLIRVNFNEVFRLLFGGGRAELRLEEEADPLEAGLEVTAQPPGKRLQNLSLLSGGEKSMTAIALLFAIFRYRPSPFCLMDEVDAALDELNVGRFTRMLREYSRDTQFIVVTHNPRSMEAADVLYGVTMPEPGISRIVSMRLPEAVAVAQ